MYVYIYVYIYIYTYIYILYIRDWQSLKWRMWKTVHNAPTHTHTHTHTHTPVPESLPSAYFRLHRHFFSSTGLWVHRTLCSEVRGPFLWSKCHAPSLHHLANHFILCPLFTHLVKIAKMFSFFQSPSSTCQLRSMEDWSSPLFPFYSHWTGDESDDYLQYLPSWLFSRLICWLFGLENVRIYRKMSPK